jgi:hypothetical protein
VGADERRGVAAWTGLLVELGGGAICIDPGRPIYGLAAGSGAESAWGCWGVMSAALGAMAGLPAQALSSTAPKTAAHAARQREWREICMAAFSAIPGRFSAASCVVVQPWPAGLVQGLSWGQTPCPEEAKQIFCMDRIMTFIKEHLSKETKCPKKPRTNFGNLKPISDCFQPDAQPEVYIQNAPTEDERYYVPFSETVLSRPSGFLHRKTNGAIF